MDPILLSDRQWAAVAPRMPRRRRTGRPRADDRCCLDAVLWVLVSGARWRDLPPGRVAPMTAWRRLRNWQETGAWPRIWQAYLGSLDAAGRKRWSRALLKGAFVPTHKAERRQAPPACGPRSPRARPGSSPAAAAALPAAAPGPPLAPDNGRLPPLPP